MNLSKLQADLKYYYSKDFWATISKFMPNYKNTSLWLKINCYKLNLFIL
ncbi:hypothetical protein CLLI_25140 [Clostridium liquoris]|jgi:hypothetical protein|uniref:Uncharacterized protein n=1 Tax=Clostridium liquoris TaxID=1289519 RepID=A0A2T0B148_9CLOT|nr:hypothetical protein CLLI_25140 [Clostridium liquoris]